MQRNEGAAGVLPASAEASAGGRNAGAASPTPLFLGFLGALVVVAAVAFCRGPSTEALIDFLQYAAVVTGCVLAAFALTMIWAARAAQRADGLARARPGATVIRAVRARGLRRAVTALRTEVPFLPFGLTLVADDTGIEVWGGSAEHPLRVGRASWEAVAAIEPIRAIRWGRAADGLAILVFDGVDGASVALPVAVIGAGLGGLSAPGREELDALVGVLRARRGEALARP